MVEINAACDSTIRSSENQMSEGFRAYTAPAKSNCENQLRTTENVNCRAVCVCLLIGAIECVRCLGLNCTHGGLLLLHVEQTSVTGRDAPALSFHFICACHCTCCANACSSSTRARSPQQRGRDNDSRWIVRPWHHDSTSKCHRTTNMPVQHHPTNN